MPFLIDPPLALPHPGYYAWFLQAEGCSPGEAWIIVGNDNNLYPTGNYWLTGRALTTCALPDANIYSDVTDMIFRMEFCKENTTAAQKETWGKLKLIYR